MIRRSAALTLLLLLSPLSLLPQESSDSTRLSIGVEVLTFFRNNEYHSDYQSGYTLPGYQVKPSVQLRHAWRDGSSLALEVGVYDLTLLGARRYPRGGWYDHLPHWSSQAREEQGAGLHLRPILTLRYSPSPAVAVSMGSLVGSKALSGELISPLYDPEYRLSRDPAQGAMIRVYYPRFSLEALVDWQGFIFPGQSHQEAFSAFLTTHYVPYSSRTTQLQLRLQGVATHRAGEIQRMIPADTLHTYLSAAAGASLRHDLPSGGTLGASFYLLGSSVKDRAPHTHKGWGGYGSLSWSDRLVGVTTDATYGDSFYAPYGGPLLHRHFDSLWRVGVYPEIHVPLKHIGELRLHGALWWSKGSGVPDRWSHMIALTMSYSGLWRLWQK